MKVNREGKHEDESETSPHFNFNILYFDQYFFCDCRFRSRIQALNGKEIFFFGIIGVSFLALWICLL